MFGLPKEQSQVLFSKPSPVMHIAFALLTVLLLAACNWPLTTTAVATTSISPTAMPPTEPPLPHTTVDASTLHGKVIFGYQGWFNCLNDGANLNTWVHWFHYNAAPTATELTVDFWPDVSELTKDELCLTDMKLPDGSPAVLFSNYNEQTVLRHFQWMEQYSIDGVAIQRFVSQLSDPSLLRVRNQILLNAIRGAEMYGRVFYIEYCFTPDMPADVMDIVQRDWADLVDNMKITDKPGYLHEDGLPVVELWGFGVKNATNATPEQAQQMINWFHEPTSPQHKSVVIGGVPSYWRTLNRDSETDPAWMDVYRSYDVLNPWAVGRYNNRDEANTYLQAVTIPDLKDTAAHGQEYMPVIFPGFSWHNLYPDYPLNAIPRQCGKFYWGQAYNVVSAGAPMVFVAMFDEVDEGTAMFKLAPTADLLPVGAKLVPLNADGCDLPSDWYLQLGGETGRMLRGEIPLTKNIPIESGTVPPTPSTLLKMPFTGSWQGNDPDDSSTIRLILRQAGNQVEGTFSDTFSKQLDGTLVRPGYWGQGSGNMISSTEAIVAFDLTRSDGASIHLDIRLILSNEDTTLTLEVPQSSSIVLHRQQ